MSPAVRLHTIAVVCLGEPGNVDPLSDRRIEAGSISFKIFDDLITGEEAIRIASPMGEPWQRFIQFGVTRVKESQRLEIQLEPMRSRSSTT